MRARNIKPGFFKNEDLAECSMAARLLAPGLWMMADREGRLEDRPKRIKGEIFPYDNIDVDPLLAELERWNHIKRYEVAGKRYIQILAFTTHQAPHVREQASAIPPFDGENVVPRQCLTTHTNPDYSGLGNDEAQPRQCLAPPDSLNPSSLNPDSSSLRSQRARASPVYTPEFEFFWKIYPRKDGSKAKAFEFYQRAISEGIDDGQLRAGAGAYADYVRAAKTEHSKIAHAATWLNQRRWESEYPAPSEARGNQGAGRASPEPKSQLERAAEAVQRARAKREQGSAGRAGQPDSGVLFGAKNVWESAGEFGGHYADFS